MPVLVESEEEEDEDSDCKDPLPEKLQSSMVRRILLKNKSKKRCSCVKCEAACCCRVLQKEILLSDVVACSVAYILTFAITASTVFLSLKVNPLLLPPSPRAASR